MACGQDEIKCHQIMATSSPSLPSLRLFAGTSGHCVSIHGGVLFGGFVPMQSLLPRSHRIASNQETDRFLRWYYTVLP